MKEIKLSQGKVTIVDDEDYEFLSQWKWYAAKSANGFYAVRHIGSDSTRRQTFMHRIILNAPPDKQCDHIDLNPLNNRRANLRLCTAVQNRVNSPKPKRKHLSQRSSIYKGVRKQSTGYRWWAKITVNGIPKWLGNYLTEKEAALAYNEAAKKYFGEFARLNVIES